MKLNRNDREVFGIASLAFGLIAMVLAFGAVVIATQSESRSDEANQRVVKLTTSAGVISSTSKIVLEEFLVTAHPGLMQSGKVTLAVSNVGTITHELVLVRVSSAAALPRVTKAGGERSVGDVDEEAIAEIDKMGETGDVPARSTVTKTFNLTPGTYVMFCNIDNKNGNTTLNHFQHGMVATLIVV